MLIVIVKLIDGTGTTVVEYIYDSWGKVLSMTGTYAGTVGLDQPFRYRGYVYDTETQWYYLQSRYYDPNTCRFISADVLLSTGQGVVGHNTFAYCLNNPVNLNDRSGCIPSFSVLETDNGGGFDLYNVLLAMLLAEGDDEQLNFAFNFIDYLIGADFQIVDVACIEEIVFGIYLPLKVIQGERVMVTTFSTGSMQKPIDFYAQYREDNWFLSSVGLCYNIAGLAYCISIGLDNIGINLSYTDSNGRKIYLSYRVDLSCFRGVLEFGISQVSSNMEVSHYYSITYDGMFALWAYAMITTGEYLPYSNYGKSYARCFS